MVTVVLSATALLLIAGGGLWFFGVESQPEANLTALEPLAYSKIKVRRNDHISIGGVKLGMSAQVVRGLHSGVSMRTVGRGEHVGEFFADGIALTLWFVDGQASGEVYRMRSREYSDRLPTDVIHARFAALYGQPAAVECRQGSRVSRQGLCRLKWITRDGIAIEVASRNLTDESGRGKTELTVTFTDTLVANKILASRQPGRA